MNNLFLRCKAGAIVRSAPRLISRNSNALRDANASGAPSTCFQHILIAVNQTDDTQEDLKTEAVHHSIGSSAFSVNSSVTANPLHHLSSLSRLPSPPCRGYSTTKPASAEREATDKDAAPNSTPSPTASVPKWRQFLSADRIQAPSTFNRWLLVPPAVAAHLALGSVYAWSILNNSLTREIGVVGSTAADWSLGEVVPIFSVICGVHGISAALLGKWQERVGPRHAGVYGALTFGAGFALAGVGVHFHSLYTAFASGVLIGAGMGLSYVPPVATLLRWFPDRRGLATGLTLMGFGGGAIFTSLAMTNLIKAFQVPPTLIGSTNEVNVITEGGRKLAEIGGAMQEVVVASEKALYRLPFENLSEGVYLAGTGCTGVTQTLLALGATYATVLTAASFIYRLPPANYTPPTSAKAGSDSKPARKPRGPITKGHVHINDVMKTPQFWQIWLAFGAVASTGMGVLSIANTMIMEIFELSLPQIVTLSFASTFVMALSAANLSGRVAWATLSDYIGRKATYSLFTGLSVPLYLSLPFFIESATASQSVVPLVGFYGTTMLLISLFGGAYSTTPAYEADIFGTKFVGATHGRMLSASAVGGLLGPTLATVLRESAERDAIRDVATKVDASVFQSEFGAAPAQVDTLLESNSISLSRLMTIAPPEIQDPTPFLYNDALYAAAGLLSLATFSNLLMRPVASKYLMKESAPLPPAAGAGRGGATAANQQQQQQQQPSSASDFSTTTTTQSQAKSS